MNAFPCDDIEIITDRCKHILLLNWNENTSVSDKFVCS